MAEVEEVFVPIENGQILFENSSKVKLLVKKECCNYDAGNCKLLDDGAYHKCPQMIAENLCCSGFVEAVLPIDKALESSVFSAREAEKKKCVTCGKTFVPLNNKAKYCRKCAKMSMKIQKANYARKKRSESKNRAF